MKRETSLTPLLTYPFYMVTEEPFRNIRNENYSLQVTACVVMKFGDSIGADASRIAAILEVCSLERMSSEARWVSELTIVPLKGTE